MTNKKTAQDARLSPVGARRSCGKPLLLWRSLQLAFGQNLNPVLLTERDAGFFPAVNGLPPLTKRLCRAGNPAPMIFDVVEVHARSVPSLGRRVNRLGQKPLNKRK